MSRMASPLDHLKLKVLMTWNVHVPRGVSAVTVCVAYIVRDSPLQPKLENHVINTVDHVRTSYPEMGFCIMGDFNKMNINSILRGNNLKQIVTFPTRGNATSALILY